VHSGDRPESEAAATVIAYRAIRKREPPSRDEPGLVNDSAAKTALALAGAALDRFSPLPHIPPRPAVGK